VTGGAPAPLMPERTVIATDAKETSMSRRIARIALPVLLLTLLAVVVQAGPGLGRTPPAGGGVPAVTVEIRPLGPLPAGGEGRLGVVYHVPAGTHLTSTFQQLRWQSEPPAGFGQAVFPEPIVEQEIGYYKGDVMAVVPVRLPAGATSLRVDLEAQYQLCREGEAGLCYAPAWAQTSAELALAPAGDAAVSARTGAADPADATADVRPERPRGLQGRLEDALDRGSWLAFLLVFLGGILASFTPCVYPMIPITVGFIGGSAKGNPAKGFVMSLWYVLGIAVVYSTLGLVAAATGGAFGQATQTPLFAGIVATVIGAMGLSMAGLFDIQPPSSLTTRIGGARTGFLGPLLMGMAMGLIAAPCVGPVLIVLLTWVATTGNLLLGFWLLFTFALGLGMLFIALGTFSGLLTALPGAGAWMEQVKHFFALVLYGLALWFLRLYVPGWLLLTMLGVLLAFSASAWGAWRPLPPDAGPRAGMGKGVLMLVWTVGVVLLLLGGLRGLAPGLLPAGGRPGPEATVAEEPAWRHDVEAAFAEAERTGRPVVMDFWAEWCAACKELDHETWSDERVLELARGFIPLKMDMTERSETNTALLRRYGVAGMPTVIFFAPDGSELERFSGFRSPEQVIPVLQRVLDRAATGGRTTQPQEER